MPGTSGHPDGVGRVLDGLWTHEGYAAQKLPDGSYAQSWQADGFVAYVAACACATGRGPDGWSSWFGATEHPATEAGEEAALAEWEAVHAGPLLAAVTDLPPDVAAEVTALLDRLATVAIERPAGCLALLRELEQRTDTILAAAVHGARAAGLSWSRIGTQLGMSKQAAQGRWS